jgi:acetyltransferase-like isoleucine patch superfamily enzyme
MLGKTFRRLIRYLALEHGRGEALYRRVCRPDGEEWAALLKKRGALHAMGVNCSVQTNVHITDPKYVRLGNNVRLSGCTIFGHDGAVNMLNRAYGLNLDRVGKVDILDNVFVGHGAIILPGATIGPNAIVAAGAVVTGNVEPDSVYGGVPARRIGSIASVVERMTKDQAGYPWRQLIAQRGPVFDPAPQPVLDEWRERHFFGVRPTVPTVSTFPIPEPR